MAESFSAALKRYIAGGYKAPEAMRAVWHDVKVGRVERPRTARQHVKRWEGRAGWRRGLISGHGNPPTIRAEDIRAGDVILPPARELQLWMRRHLREKGLPESALELTVESVREGNPDKGGRWLIVSTSQNEAWFAGQPRPSYAFTFKVRPASPWPILRRPGGTPNPRRGSGNPVTLTARAAGKIVRADPAVRRLPRVGWCVRLSDGRELCHDARGYYLVGAARNPSRKMGEYQARLDRQVAATRQRRALARGPATRDLIYYAWARRPSGQLGLTLVRQAGGGGVTQTWTGVTYRNMREAEADVVRRNMLVVGARRNPADPSRFLPSGHPVYQTRQRVPKWTGPVSPAHVPRLLRHRLGHFSKAQHEQHAREHQHRSEVAEDRWQQLVTAATRQYGSHGPLISGVVREHFPDTVKRELRQLARAISEERDVAWAHWKAAGHRTGLTGNPRGRPRGRARREAIAARHRFGMPEYSAATGHVHSLIHDDYIAAMQRAEYYRWAAGKGFAARDPVTGREMRGGVFQRAERDCNKAQARIWLAQAAKLRGSMGRQVLPNPPRFKVGDRASIADPVRTTARFWSAQHGGVVGAGGTILPRAILDRPGTVASVGAGQRGIKRVLLDWGMDAENRSLGIWLDSDQLVRAPGAHANPRRQSRIRRNQPLTVGAPEIRAFLTAWHEEGRAHFQRSYPSLDYDSPAYQKTAKDRRKYIALDAGDSGRFLVDKATGEVYTIKAYGVPNRRIGTLAEVAADYAAARRDPYGRRVNPPRRRTAGAWGSMGLLPRRRSRRPFRNPIAGFETFDLADRAGWERAIRTAGGLRVSKAERGELVEVPGYLKGYKRGVAPDELAQMIAGERGLPARQVERAMLAAFHGPRRRARSLEDVDYERLEREAIQLEGAGRARGSESRPRVRVGLDVFTLRPRSPWKGSIHHVNPPRPRGTLIYPRVLELRALKGRHSHFPRERFRHAFRPGAQAIGLPSGDVLLHGARGQWLWQHVEV